MGGSAGTYCLLDTAPRFNQHGDRRGALCLNSLRSDTYRMIGSPVLLWERKRTRPHSLIEQTAIRIISPVARILVEALAALLAVMRHHPTLPFLSPNP